VTSPKGKEKQVSPSEKESSKIGAAYLVGGIRNARRECGACRRKKEKFPETDDAETVPLLPSKPERQSKKRKTSMKETKALSVTRRL
jgi:hypothetical protein